MRYNRAPDDPGPEWPGRVELGGIVAQPMEWDEGLDAGKFRRVMELALWLQGRPNGSSFTRDDVIALSAWAHFGDQAPHGFTQEFSVATEMMRTFGLEVDWVGDAYRKRQRIRLNAEERQALLLALAVADPGDPRGTDGVPFGLGIDRRDAEALLDFADELDVIIDAIDRRCAVEISHRGRRRRVDPYGIGFRNSRWYLVGRDHTRDRLRVFGLGRGGPNAAPAALVGGPDGFEPPADLDVSDELIGALDPARWSDRQPVIACVRVDGAALPLAHRLFPGLGVDDDAPSRSTPGVVEAQTIEVDGLDLDGIVAAMAALRTHAVLLEPPEAVDALCHHLRAIVDAAPIDVSSNPRTPGTVELRSEPARRSPTKKAGGQLRAARRLQIITTALALGEGQDGTTTVAEVAAATHATPEQVRWSLRQYEYASVVIDDDDHFVHSGLHVDSDDTITVTDPWLLNEWQPSLPQALRLYVAATTALALTSAATRTAIGPNPDARLETARNKLGRYLADAIGRRGDTANRALRKLIEITPPDKSDLVRKIDAIVKSGKTIFVEYQDPLRTAGTTAVELDPVRLHLANGQWVLEGRVRCDGDGRADAAEFVVIPESLVHGVSSGASDAACLSGGFDVTPVHDPVVAKLELDPDKLWMLDQYPVRKLYRVENLKVRATVEIPNLVELRTLMLRLGAAGRLRSPKELRGVPAAIASEMLARHGC